MNITAKNLVKNYITAGILLIFVLLLSILFLSSGNNFNPYGDPEDAGKTPLAITYVIIIPAVLIFSSLSSLMFATIHRKKASVFFKRMLERMFILFVVGFAVNMIGGIILQLILTPIVYDMKLQFLKNFIYNFPSMIIYLIFAYKIVCKQAASDCSGKSFNIHFFITTLVYTLITAIPQSVYCSIYFKSPNCFNLFIPYFTLFNEYGSREGPYSPIAAVIGLIIALAAAAAILSLAYINGKNLFKSEHPHMVSFETDEGFLS